MNKSRTPDGSRTSDYEYELPQELIAQFPYERRSDSRMLVVDRLSRLRADSVFWKLGSWLNPGDLLVMNDVKVLPARMYGQRQSGGRVQLMLERILDDNRVLVQLKSNRSIKEHEPLLFENRHTFHMVGRQDEFFELKYMGGRDLVRVFEEDGHIPLPPYIKREDEENDRHDYQTVYARKLGAVAAPTAGLHFTKSLIDELQQAGVQFAYVTLYVGAGTFKPVKDEDPALHKMHFERYELGAETCTAIANCKQRGGRVIAVGTTSVRVLESAAESGMLQPAVSESNLFIRPGYQFRVIDGLITNFHLPRSTLMMLVSALAGFEFTLESYRYAVAEKYRFFSYGDAMLIIGNARQKGEAYEI